MKRTFVRIVCMVLVLLCLTACTTQTAVSESGSSLVEGGNSQPVADSPQLKDDFYEAVNAEWLSTAEIPPDMPYIAAISEMEDRIKETLIADFDAMLTDGGEAAGSELENFLKFYRMTTDYEAREAAGLEPLRPYLERIEALSSLADFQAQWADWMLDSMPSPFSFGVTADMGNAAQNALYAAPASMLFYDKSYYEDAGTLSMMQQYYSEYTVSLLVALGKGEEEASGIVEEAMAFDAAIVPYMKSAEEAADTTAGYNPTPLGEFTVLSSNFNYEQALTDLLGQAPKTVVLTNPAYFAATDTFLNDETFPQMKSWMTVQLIYTFAPYLTEEFGIAASGFGNLMMGVAEPEPREERAYHLASSIFGEVIGQYYGATYFGEQARQDVTEMVESMIAVYQTRLENNTWLSAEAKKKAVLKLDAMVINVGYPDSLDPLYAEMIPDEDKTLLDNVFAFIRMAQEDNLASLERPTDRTEWVTTGDTVNAFYAATNNSINFPAGFLQVPFYSIEQDRSTNYGGIGAVIGHEISHAFDPNGSQFDELGSIANWWTEEDHARFEELSTAMVALFDGREHAGGRVNGTLTLAENIADAGGLSCALEALKAHSDADLEVFFTSWAVIWRMKATDEISAMLLAMDTHAPNKLRANIQLQNLDDFYTTFSIVEGDGMYLAPEDRVSIW